MRKGLNENPVAQIAVFILLAVLVAFLLLTRVANTNSGDGTSASSTAPSTSAPADAPSTPTPSPTADAASSSGAPPAATSPSDGTAPPAVPAGAASLGKFVAGPGLPAPVVRAYTNDKTVVLLVLRRHGIDDDRLRENVERLSGRNDLALFVTNAGHIARYSRITYGVNVDRVPVLIVLRPRHLTRGTPKATLSYGFRGPESVDQAIRDALYKGPSDLPYYPR